MFQKIHKFIERIKYKFSKERCYDDRKPEYQERDTKCDKCEFRDQCILLDCTLSWDTRRHYIPAIGNECKKERLVYERCKDCPYYYGEPDVPNDMERKCVQ